MSHLYKNINPFVVGLPLDIRDRNVLALPAQLTRGRVKHARHVGRKEVAYHRSRKNWLAEDQRKPTAAKRQLSELKKLHIVG